MNKDVKKIEIVFENCETLVIPIERIGQFILDDIHQHISRIALNSVQKHEVADTIFIEIFNRKRNKKLYRISDYKDITQIYITYDDSSEECYFTDYREPEGHEDDLGAPNINQTTYITDKGDILLTIANGKDWHDFMSLDEKLDKEDVRYTLLGVIEDDNVEGNIFTPNYNEASKEIEEKSND